MKQTLLLKQNLAEIKKSKQLTVDIHDAGAKDGNKGVAPVAVVKNDIFLVLFPNEVTILTAEARAIDLQL